MSFKAQELIDSFTNVDAGVNEGVSPDILPKNQLARALNITVRGTFANPRPYYKKMTLDYGGNAALQSMVEKPLWQKGCYYKPDFGLECLTAAIAGRLFKFEVSGDTLTVSDITGASPQVATQTQAWLWQSENFLIFNDGVSNPLFYDGTNTTRSNSGLPVKLPIAFQNTAPFTIPAVGATSAGVAVDNTTNVNVGDTVTLKNKGQFVVQAVVAGVSVDLLNISAGPVGQILQPPAPLTPNFTGFDLGTGDELPPGRMGVYGMGRNWVCLVDGKQFVASDAVGGSSGTPADNYRDAVLHITENNYLAGGGNFTVPGSIGDIHFMQFTATLDSSLGQGPLQVGVPSSVFSVNSPVDRLTWQDITNPILTESLISNGGLSQESTINANSDLIMRSEIGIVSLILARREDNTWGIVPISREVAPTLDKDQADLLIYGSAIVFDNRLLMTCTPVATDHGVYHKQLVALNFDPVSTLRGKAPSVYDGIWSGLNILQVLTGRFENRERAFAFTLNTFSDTLEVWEILQSSDTRSQDNKTGFIADDDGGIVRQVVFAMESPSMFNYPATNELSRTLKCLKDGEIEVDNLYGKVHFEVLYKPDQWPCWVPWHQWDTCAGNEVEGKPAFRPRMGFGEPSMSDCDPYNNRVLREAYNFQVKIIVTGQCEVKTVRLKANTVPETPFAQPVCDPICET